MDNFITCEQFKERLGILCVTSGQTTFTRRLRDRHILLKSMVLELDATKTYTEQEIDKTLMLWLSTIGEQIEVDYVNLRRLLVDFGYLWRAEDGSFYRVTSTNYDNVVFEPTINNVNHYSIIRKHKILVEQKKRAYYTLQ